MISFSKGWASSSTDRWDHPAYAYRQAFLPRGVGVNLASVDFRSRILMLFPFRSEHRSTFLGCVSYPRAAGWSSTKPRRRLSWCIQPGNVYFVDVSYVAPPIMLSRGDRALSLSSSPFHYDVVLTTTAVLMPSHRSFSRPLHRQILALGLCDGGEHWDCPWRRM